MPRRRRPDELADQDETLSAAAPSDGEGRGAAAGTDEAGVLDDPEGAEERIEELQSQLDEQERAAAEAQDRYLRALADFDNYRKRQATEMADARRFANEGLIGDLLSVLDNFERAIGASETQANPDALVEGVRLIHRQLADVLKKAGLEPIESVGQPFDPTVHEAIMEVEPAEGQAPHEVAEELRRGYRLNGRVVRPSLVKVTSG